MQYWIVQHKDGAILPVMAGPSFWKPGVNKGLPRLFSKKSVAKGWITTYCKGPLLKEFRETMDGTEYLGVFHDESRKRNPADFQVREVKLEVL